MLYRLIKQDKGTEKWCDGLDDNLGQELFEEVTFKKTAVCKLHKYLRKNISGRVKSKK